MLDHGPIADSFRSSIGHPAATDPCPRVVRPFRRHGLDAGSTTILCFAFLHVLIRLVDAGLRRDARSLNVFTMLEAQRLWPALRAGSSAAWWSLAFALAVYGIVHAAMASPGVAGSPLPAAIERRRTAEIPICAGSPFEPNGAASNGHAAAAGPPALASRPGCIHFSLGAGLLALAGGVGVHMAALALIERFVRAFPPLPDVVHAHLPYVDFGWPGEVAYAAFLLTAIVVMLRTQPRSMPATLTMLGLFYAVRGVFLFLMPIGSPPTAPPLEARFVFWPFAAHAYFPGGHTGMMTIVSLSVVSSPWRRVFLAFTFAFAIGTLLARTHYAADAFGGWLTAYGIVLWGRRRLFADPPDRQRVEASRPWATRQELEVHS